MKALEEIKQMMAAGETVQADEALKELLEKEQNNLQAKMLYGTCRQLLGDVRSWMLMAIVLVSTVAFADVAPMAGEYEMAGIAKSLQSPVFLSFWFLWGGMAVIPLALFFMRSSLRVAMTGLGVLMLIIGLVTGARNYDYCGRCGTRLERWYDMEHHEGCPKCSPDVRYRHVPEHIRKTFDQQSSGLPEMTGKRFNDKGTWKRFEANPEVQDYEDRNKK